MRHGRDMRATGGAPRSADEALATETNAVRDEIIVVQGLERASVSGNTVAGIPPEDASSADVVTTITQQAEEAVRLWCDQPGAR